MLKNKLFTILTLLRQSVRSYQTPLCTINVTVSETDTIKCNMAQIYFLIKNNQLVQDSFSGVFLFIGFSFVYSQVKKVIYFRKIVQFQALVDQEDNKPSPFPPQTFQKEKRKEREEIIYMYLHVITSGIRNRTCTWQENIDLVQDMIIIGGHLYLKCNFNRVCLNCSLILWLNYSLLQLINLQNDLIKNTIRKTVVNLFLKIFAC